MVRAGFYEPHARSLTAHLELAADGEEHRGAAQENEQGRHEKVAHRPQRVRRVAVVKPACSAAGGGALDG